MVWIEFCCTVGWVGNKVIIINNHVEMEEEGVTTHTPTHTYPHPIVRILKNVTLK
jgi:hypothetical protein